MSEPANEKPIIPSVPLEDIFESNTEFDTEPTGRTMGRASWLAVRSTAELLLFVSKLNITVAQRAGLMAVFAEVADDWLDFVHEGVGHDGNQDTGDTHPQEGELRDLIEVTTDAWDIQTMGDGIFGAEHAASDFLMGLGSLPSREIIEMVRDTSQEAIESP